MNLIFVRHTTTDWNLLRKMQGHTDRELAPEGREEAEEIAKFLLDLTIESIVSSPLKRAVQTAEILKQWLQVPITYDDRLRECSFGRLEGLTRAEGLAQHGQSLGIDWDDQAENYDLRRFGGEERDSVLQRHMSFVEELDQGSDGSYIVIVGHGRGLNTLLAGLGFEPNLNRGDYKIISYIKK